MATFSVKGYIKRVECAGPKFEVAVALEGHATTDPVVFYVVKSEARKFVIGGPITLTLEQEEAPS